MKSTIIILLLILLFSPIFLIDPNEIEEIDFDGEYFSKLYDEKDPKYFKILFTIKEIKKYLKIEVENVNENENPGFSVAFSNTDESCLEREQLSYGTGKMQMLLTKAQVENSNNYLNIACNSTTSCHFELRLYGNDQFELDYNSQLNFYVTENNKKVEIDIESLSTNSDESDFITIWAIGNKNVDADIKDVEYKKYSKNNIFKINTSTINKSAYVLQLSGEEGDLINIGSSKTSTNGYNNLVINQPEIKGFLEKDFSTQDCYQLNSTTSSDFYLSGIIYTKIAEIVYENENGEEISDTLNIIRNGSFIHKIKSDEDKKYFCIRFPTKESEAYDLSEIFYSVQLTDPGSSYNKVNLYSPQILGVQYPRMLPEKQECLYIGLPPNDEVETISLEMISQFGFPDMFYKLCSNYPLCTKFEGGFNPRSINDHSTYIINYEPKSPMSPTQYVLWVNCINNGNVGGPCGFKTLFHSDKDKINLKEGEPLSQYILKGEKDLYRIDFSGENKIQKIYVDLMVLTGDVIFATDSKIDLRKYYNANKIFYSIKINPSLEVKEIDFSVSASKNSFYFIEFTFVREKDDSWLTNIIEPGLSYLVTIDPEAKDSSGHPKPYKIVKFKNIRAINENPLLVQFYSLNCKLDVIAKRVDHNETLDDYDHYYQDIVIKNQINDFEYILNISEVDSTIYNNKLCMAYASSLETNYVLQLDENQIVISDNEPRQMTFKQNYKDVEYLYPLSNTTNDVVVKFYFLDLATYTVTITFDHRKSTTYKQSGNDIIYLSHNEWKTICKEDEICPITINIHLESTYIELEPKLVISVKGVQENTPSYINKNKVILDFLLGQNYQYYYTDLGEGEEGYVIVNYRRGSGTLYGKIVQKSATVPEKDADWREMYKFPTTPEESLELYGYIKKIIIKKEETEKCADGCYLLLSLKTSIVSKDTFNYDFREHPFSIIINTKVSEKIEDVPIVNMPLNEYIIGNLYTHKEGNMNEYYSTIFTHNSNKIIFDIQSKVINYYINVGDNRRPSITDYDYKIENTGEDTLFEITRDDFLKKCKEKGVDIPHENSLLGLSLTVGLWTNKTDELYTTVYAMEIHLPFHDSLDIYEVKYDQKTICKTTKVGKQYRCLFMVFYLGIDQVNHLLLYPRTKDHSSYVMYAKFIVQEKYENFDYIFLKEAPNENENDYSTKDSGLEYLYVEHGKEDENFLYVSIITQKETTIELYSSFYTYDKQLSPNPSSAQLFTINKDNFLFEFMTIEDIIITLKSVCGKGKIYWEVDKNEYSMYGRDDLLYLTNSLIDKSEESKVHSKLYIENKDTIKNCPGFAFYIDYILRPAELNLDEIQLGSSTEIGYRETDLPVYLYSRINDIGKDVNVFVNLYELIGGSISSFTTSIPFKINATVINDSKLTNLKLGIDKIDDVKFDINGFYDHSIKTGFVLITESEFKKRKIKMNEGVNVIFMISKNDDYPGMKQFTRVTLEAGVFQNNSDIPLLSNHYHYGRLGSGTVNSYKLKTDKSAKYMRIQYSHNRDNFYIAINNKTNSTTNGTFKEFSTDFVDGKTIITFNSEPEINDFIYLNVFQNSNDDKDKTKNYVFKYMNSNDPKDFILYKLLENEGFQLDKSENGDKFDYTFTISPLSYSNLDIKYLIKIVLKEDWIEGEADNSIALRESTSYIEELNIKELKDGKIVRKYEKINELDYRYVQVIAIANDGVNVEYIGYKSIYVEDSIVWKVILIIVIVLLVVGGGGYLLHLYLKKRRDVDKKVGKLSGPMVSVASEASENNEL